METKWIQLADNKCKCPVCDTIAYIALYPSGSDKNFCPNCGTDLRVKTKADSNKDGIRIFTQDGIRIFGAELLTYTTANLLSPSQLKYDNDWWLSGSNVSGAANYVSMKGSYGMSLVHATKAIRPVLRIDTSKTKYKVGDTFEFGTKEFLIIAENLAWMHNDDIGKSYFRMSCYSNNSNAYYASYAKKMVDKWFSWANLCIKN